MLDTSKIPIEDLPDAMYKESMKSWNDAYTSAFNFYSNILPRISQIEACIDDKVSKKNYALASYYMSELRDLFAQLIQCILELQNLIRIIPKGFEEET